MSQKIIVIPCYNEAKRLNQEAFLAYLENGGASLLFVDDGSSDNTIQVINNLIAGWSKASLLCLPQNVGKAEAVRQGVLAAVAKGAEQVAFLDADLAVGLEQLDPLFSKLENYQMAFGSRIRVLNSKISRFWLRHYLSRIFATCASVALGFQIYDTQCGAKVFKGELASRLFAESFYSRWLFDVEIFFRLKALGQPSELAYELPLVNWREIGGSKVNPRVFLRAPLELWRIKKAYEKNN